MIVKFIGSKAGYVIDPGTSGNETGSLHTDWRHYNEDCWKPYDYEATTTTTPTRTPDPLELFETIRLTGISSSTLTKVPNGYVMTSSSGHQLFIKDLSKDSL